MAPRRISISSISEIAPTDRPNTPIPCGTTLLWCAASSLTLPPTGYTYLNSISEGADMQVAKWGNSLAVRLPAAVVEALELHEGDDVEVVIAGAREFQIKKKPTGRT